MAGILLGILLIALAIILEDCAGPAGASILAPAGVGWHTCKPLAIDYVGQLRYDNDLFAGRAGPSCITVRGTWLTITSNVPGDSGGVVSYPSVYIGQNGTSGDQESGLPVPVTRAHAYVEHVALGGRASAGSDYMQDLDVWLAPSKATASQHGNAELVIAFRGRGAGGIRMSMGGHWYLVSHWITHMRNAAGSAVGPGWPLFLIRADGNVASRSIRPATFIWHLRKLGLVSSREWLTEIRLGTECWQGCRGLTESMVPGE